MEKLYQKIIDYSKEYQSAMLEWRRTFHKYPEIELDVPKTAETIREILKSLDIELLENVPGHTVIGRLHKGDEFPSIGLRADMDALPIPENTGLDFASQNDQRMHACGHDGHMAMLLGAASILSHFKNEVNQNIYFIFQPGEENPGGAKAIMESGVLKDLDAIFGIHLDPFLESGKAAVNRDRAMASTDCFYITITGKGGHAALPHESIDPIAMAAQIINSLQFIVSRLIDPIEPAVLTLGSIDGGYIPNVIPDSVKLSGTIRAFSEEIRLQIQEEIKKTLEMYCSRYGAKFDLEIMPGYPPVINTASMCDYLLKSAEALSDILDMEEMAQPRMAGEDFSYYLKEIPGAFYWLGCRNEEKGCTYPLHHSRFNLDEDVLPLGAIMHSLSALLFEERKI